MTQIIITIICILICGIVIYKTKENVQDSQSAEQEYQNLLDEIEHLKDQAQFFKENTESLQKQSEKMETVCREKEQRLAEYKAEEKVLLQRKQECLDSIAAFSEKLNDADNLYSKAEEEARDEYLSILEDKKNDLMQIQEEIVDVRAKLAALKATFQASIKVTEPEDGNHVIPLSSSDLADLSLINSIRGKLIKADALDKVLWDVYFKAPVKSLLQDLTHGRKITCIYKIENFETHEVYIGQTLDYSTRMTAHIKNGLAALNKTTANKLYTNMAKYGLDCFSFTIVEECGKDELDAKEKYWIDYFNSKEKGLNTTSGNGAGL